MQLRKITKKNLFEILDLKSREKETKTVPFVATNADSIAEAYVDHRFTPLGIYRKGIAIGFTMLIIKPEAHVVRFMIDFEHQNKGYGTLAFKMILIYLKSENAKHITIGSNNPIAIKLYEKQGFKKTGTQYGEIKLELTL